jgi:hypothetical protein
VSLGHGKARFISVERLMSSSFGEFVLFGQFFRI